MTDLTAQYRAKNGVAQFEIFGERDGALYGRVKNKIADNIWYPCAWNLQIEGKSSVSDYYDIEPAPPKHATEEKDKRDFDYSIRPDLKLSYDFSSLPNWMDEGLSMSPFNLNCLCTSAPIESKSPSQPDLKIDDLVWVWNDGGHKKIRCFANWLSDGSIRCFHDGKTSLSNTAVFSWDNWEKYEPEKSTPETVKAECDDDKAWMDVLSYSGVNHPMTPSDNAIISYFAGKAQHVKIDVVYSPETSKAEPKWHEYLKQGYMIVCEVWHDIEPVPPIVQMVNAIRGDGLYMGEIAWDFARPVPTECGKFCTGIKDGKTILLPLG